MGSVMSTDNDKHQREGEFNNLSVCLTTPLLPPAPSVGTPGGKGKD
jgi:hypothetical protein